MIPKIQPCLWFDRDAEAAARFYADTFPESRVGTIMRAPADYPSGKAGDVLTVEAVILGMPFVLLNGGPEFKHSEAVSFMVATEDQDETDRYWNAITTNGGTPSVCGWCKDRFGLSWQIQPKVLLEYEKQGGEIAKRAFEAMMTMTKIDIAALERAVAGASVTDDKEDLDDPVVLRRHNRRYRMKMVFLLAAIVGAVYLLR